MVDVAAVVLFVAIGRASHHDHQTVAGFVSTAWPFATGLAAGWGLAWRLSLPRPRTGAVVCAVTVAVGMALRVVAGQGTAVSFVVVAVVFLGAVMITGRILARRTMDAERRTRSVP